MRVILLLTLLLSVAHAVKARVVYGILITPRAVPSIRNGHTGIDVNQSGVATVFRSDGTQAPFGTVMAPLLTGRSSYKLYPVDGLDFQAVSSCESRPGRVALWRGSTGQIKLRLSSGTEVELAVGSSTRPTSASGTPLEVSCLEFVPLQRSPFKPGEAGLWVDVSTHALKARKPDGTDTIAGCGSSSYVDVATCATPVCSFATTYPGCTNEDTDGDGFGNAWEVQQGIDFNCDGMLPPSDLVLTGANAAVKDVFVSYDWMVDGGAPNGDTRSHKPFETCTVGSGTSTDCATVNPGFSTPYAACSYQAGYPGNLPNGTVLTGSVERVIAAFANSGIVLHTRRGQAIPHYTVMTLGPLKPNVCTIGDPPPVGQNAQSFYTLRSLYEPTNRDTVDHYAIFGHNAQCATSFTCSLSGLPCGGPYPYLASGKSEVFGKNFMVTMAGFTYSCLDGWINNEAGVFMHELGHNFNLSHGGLNDTDNFKPNYISVMNYNYINTGLLRFSPLPPVIDYSHGPLNAIDENNLNEETGVNPFSSYLTVLRCSGVQYQSMGSIDWNCNGEIDFPSYYPSCVVDDDCCPVYDPTCAGGVPPGFSCVAGVCTEAVDIVGGNDGPLHTLVDHNDWADLNYLFQCAPPPSDDNGLSRS